MSTITFHQARLHGSAAVPPAKSEMHRALLLSALGRGKCTLYGFAPPLCDDAEAMLSGIEALGATVAREGDALCVTPAPMPAEAKNEVVCDVRACAAALRMLIPAFLSRGQSVRFVMDAGLYRRPLTAYEPLMKKLGATMTLIPPDEGGRAAVVVKGLMPAGTYEIDGSQSSQFASGMLIALSHARDKRGEPAPSTLTVAKPIVSRPYLDMTLKLMERFHAPWVETQEGVFALSPASEPSPGTATVTGDWSQAAVLLCANAMGGGVMLQNLAQGELGGLQGDARVMEVLGRMGLRISCASGELYAVTPSRDGLLPVTLDCSDIPDIAPILALTCTQAHGRSVLTGVGRLRIKECDRLDATVKLLRMLGARVENTEDTMTVYGKTKLHGGFTADARGDHRMVMLLATAALIADAPIAVAGAEALNKSWPGFLDVYRQLGGVIS